MEPCPVHPSPPLLDAATPLAELTARFVPAWRKLHEILGQEPPPQGTLGELAQALGRPVTELLFPLHQAMGSLHRYLPALEPGERGRLTRLFPSTAVLTEEAFQTLWESFSPEARRELETRPILARGEDPFAAIQAALSALPPHGALLLRVPFEPVPLYQVLAQQGFGVAVRMDASGWRVCVARRLAVDAPQRLDGAARPAPPESPEPLDVRGLPPPEPMLRVLEAVTRLTPGGALTVVHDRIPALLYPRLAERGLEVTTEEKADGEVWLTIRRPGKR